MSDENEQGRLTRLRLALGMAVFGSATPVSKIVTDAMPVFVGSAFRVGLGAFVLAPFAWRNLGDVKGFTRRDWLIVCLIALFGMFGFSALMLYGMKMVQGVVGAIVMSTAPAVTAAASMLFFGDSPTWRKLGAIVLAVAGVLVLQMGQGDSGGGSGSDMWLGAALVFAAVCCEASYTLLGKRMSEHVDPVLVAFLASALSLPVFIPFAIWQWPDFDAAQVSAGAWAAAIWYGAGTLSLGTWLWYSGLAKAEGAVAAAFMGIMPVSALLLSYLLLGEKFQWMHIAGFGTVFAGVLLMSWEHARMSKKQ